jgi:hypothetical protein
MFDRLALGAERRIAQAWHWSAPGLTGWTGICPAVARSTAVVACASRISAITLTGSTALIATRRLGFLHAWTIIPAHCHQLARRRG